MAILITEVNPNGSSAAGYSADWFELTNTGAGSVDITNWRMDDNSNSFASSVALSGVTSILPGQSVIFIEGNSTTAANFISAWFGNSSAAPSGFAIGTYSGSGVGLSNNGDAVNIFDAGGIRITGVSFGAVAATATLDNAAGAGSTTLPLSVISTNSVAGTNGAFTSFSSNEIGSPGTIANSALATVSILTTDASASETASNSGTFRIFRTGNVANALTVNYTISGTATNGTDYTPTLTGSAIIAANQSFVDITITPVDDAIFEGNETATLTLSNSANYNLSSATDATVTIADNDSGAAPTIAASASTTSFLSVSSSGPGRVGGVISDPTDPAATLGIDFTLADADTPVNNLTVSATSSNQAVVTNANLTFSGTGATRNLKINPTGVGYANLTVTVSDGSSTANYIINYAASAASSIPATSRFFTGTSDASTAVDVGGGYMLVGDDEDQALRLYDRDDSGLPIASFDFSTSLGLLPTNEVDIEASTRSGNTIYWMGSHSNSSGGSDRPEREKIFATTISGTGAITALTFAGYYNFLEDDLIAWDNSNGHGLGAGYLGLAASAAAGVIPEIPNGSGFSIEGLTLAPNGTTAYVSFRAPLEPTNARTRALIIPVTNFTTILNPSGGTSGSATFGAPIQLNLGGRGIRSIEGDGTNGYVIVAGPPDGATGTAPKDFRLYTWTGNPTDAPVLRSANLTGLNTGGSIEGIILPNGALTDSTQIQVVSDSGDTVWYNDSIASKSLPQDNFQKFRTDIITIGSPVFNQVPGTAANDVLTGTAAADNLIGGAGSDVINGGTGDDTINGGAARDILVGGLGADVFTYGSLTDSTATAADAIRDFGSGADRFQLPFIPTGLFDGGTVAGTTLADAATAAFAAVSLGANQGVFFTWTQGRKFLAVNDTTAGFSPTNDLVVELPIATVFSTSVSNYFI